MTFDRSQPVAGLRRSLAVLLAALVLVLQTASPHASATRRVYGQGSDARIAALAQVVGHAVETCAHGDGDDRAPADDAAPCCPCLACHALVAALPSAPRAAAEAPPVLFVGVALYPQPPPRRVAATHPASAGPRGPPHLA